MAFHSTFTNTDAQNDMIKVDHTTRVLIPYSYQTVPWFRLPSLICLNSKRAEGRGLRFFKTLSAGETRGSNPQTGIHLIELKPGSLTKTLTLKAKYNTTYIFS